MKAIKVEGLGMSDPKEFDFSICPPFFMGDSERLVVITHDGTSYNTVSLPVCCDGNVGMIEVANPDYPEGMAEGAIYQVCTGSGTVVIDLCFDGVYFGSKASEMKYYPFDGEYSSSEEIAESFDIDALMLSALLMG